MFRRRRSTDEPDDAFETDDVDQVDDDGNGQPADEAPLGPWDSDDTPDDGLDRIDLGSLRVAALEGTELQLQVDEQTGEVQSAMLAAPDELLLIDEAIDRLAREDARAAQLVRLRYFAGMSVEEAAELSGLSRSTAYELWSYARAWLHCELYGR